MVVHLSVAIGSSFVPKRTRPSLAQELDARAAAALDKAREVLAGNHGAEAMNRAKTLRNAAEMHEYFFCKIGTLAK